MRKKYGDNFVVVLGDYSANGVLRGHRATQTVKWRSVFRRHGIRCFLIDEYRTSKICPQCGSKVYSDILPERKHPNWRHRMRRGKNIWQSVHGMLGCTSRHCTQNGRWLYYFWNRDDLATMNMLNIVESHLRNQGRPVPFQRENWQQRRQQQQQPHGPVYAGH